MDEVAKVAGVGKGTIYRYFEDKEDLFLQLAAEGLDALCSVVRERILPQDLPFEEKLLAMCEEMSAFGRRRHDILRVVREGYGGSKRLRHSDLIQEKRRQVLEAITEILAWGKGQGKIREDIEPKQAALLLHSMLMSRRRRHHHKDNEPLALATIVGVYCHGICPQDHAEKN